MDITTHVEFAADPTTTFGILTDPGFLEEVARDSQGTNIEVSVDGDTTTSKRDLPAPEMARKLTGPTLRIEEIVAWGPAEADGSRTGDLTVQVQGQPAKMRGTVRLAPGGPGSVADVTGDFKVNVPLMGKKIEKMAAPLVVEGIKMWGTVAAKRLA